MKNGSNFFNILHIKQVNQSNLILYHDENGVIATSLVNYRSYSTKKSRLLEKIDFNEKALKNTNFQLIGRCYITIFGMIIAENC